MAGAIHIQMKAPKFAILAARARGLSEQGVERAIASSLTFIAKDYAAEKLRTIDKDIDRPRPFSRNAYSWDGVPRGKNVELISRAYVRPKQASYLELPEFGGEKEHKTGEKDGPVWIKDDYKDKFGGGWGKQGFQRKWLSKTGKKMSTAKRGKNNAYAAGTKLYRVFTMKDRLGKWGGDVTGIWELTKLAKGSQGSGRRKAPHFGPNLKKSWKTFLIVAFIKRGEYDDPHLNFRKDGMRFGQEKLPKMAQRLLDRELAKLT